MNAIAVGLALSFIGATYLVGLYDNQAVLNFERTCWRTSLVVAPIFALAVVATGALAEHTTLAIYPHRLEWTLALTGFWFACAILLRVVFRGALRSGYFTRRILLIAGSRQAVDFSDLVANSHQRFQLVGQLDPSVHGNLPVQPESFTEWAFSQRASEVVVAVDTADSSIWHALSHCRFAGLPVTDYLDFCERETKRLSVDDLSHDRIALCRGYNFGYLSNRLRRLMDIGLALILFASSAPVFALAALAIKLQDGGPIFYRQARIGLGGKTFSVLKFRSMRVDAEGNGVPAWAVERDSRITGVGRVIRKLRIDELPQFLNVLRGDMAMIGPRPERPYFVQQFSQTIPFYDCRHVVKPGITGWAQVSFRYGASPEDTKRKLSYDLYYVKNRNFFLDIVILIKTVGVVLRGEGAR
jgi:sugar transferase (PEP-CTERM system associated)